MEKQKENPKSMNNSRKGEKGGFNVGGAGGIVVIGATVVAAAIGAAFVAYRDKRCSKQGADQTSKNGVDEMAEKDLLHLGKLAASSDNLVIHENVNPKNETIEDNFDNNDGEKLEDGLDETGDSSTESNIEATSLSERTDHNKPSIREEFAFGSLIEIQETNPDMTKEVDNHKSSCNSSTVDTETVKETVEMSAVDIEYNPSYDFSFWNNDLNKHKEMEDVVKAASEKSEERADDVFELEDEEYTSIEQRNGNSVVVTSETSEIDMYKQSVENMKTEKEVGDVKDGGAISYVGVEAEQKSKGDGISDTNLVEDKEAKKVNDTANVVNDGENEDREDGQSKLKEEDEKDVNDDDDDNITIYVEVEGKVVEMEKEIFTENEQRKGDDIENTEGEDDNKVRGDDITCTKLDQAEETDQVNDAPNFGYEKEKGEDNESKLKETDEKDEYKKEQNIIHMEVEEKLIGKEDNFALNEEIRGDDKKDEEDGKVDVTSKENADNETIIHSEEMEKEEKDCRNNVEHGENEGTTGVHLSMKFVEEQEKAGDVTLAEVRERNSRKDIGGIQETNNKVREEEEQGDNTYVEVGITMKEERNHIGHVQGKTAVMEKDSKDICRDDIEVEIEVVEEKEVKGGQKGVDDDVESLEENEEQKGEYIALGEEPYEEMKPVKAVENEEIRDENAGNLLLVEISEDIDDITPIEAGEAEGRSKEENGIVYVGIEVGQNTKWGNAYTEKEKGNKDDYIHNAVHGQQNQQEEEVEITREYDAAEIEKDEKEELVNMEQKEIEDNVEIIREVDIVNNEADEKKTVVAKEWKEEAKVEKIGVAEEKLQDVVSKREMKEENQNIILKEMENVVEENGIEVQSAEEQESKDIAPSDEANKEFVDFTQEKGRKVEGEEGKEHDDFSSAEVEVLILEEEEHDDRRHAEEEDKYRDDRSSNVEMKSVEGYGIINIENNLKETENKEEEEEETANTELNVVESAKIEDMALEEEIKTVDDMKNKNSEEFNHMNKEIASESFAAFQKADKVEKDDEENDDDTENEMKQQFDDHSQPKNSDAMEDAKCLVLEKKNKTPNTFMDHISKGLFLLVLAMSIAVVILSIFAQQDHLYYYYDHHLPQFCREIFHIFSLSINQTAEIQ